MHFAHSNDHGDQSGWQPLAEHLQAVARLAAIRGEKFGVAKAARLAGLLHDLGKYSRAFQLYIANRGPGTNHSTAGAREVLEQASRPADRPIVELIAYGIAGHHAGLPDRSGETRSLDDRLADRTIPPLDPVWRDKIAIDAAGLMPTGFCRHPDKVRHAFQLAFLGRMIFSCLVDADFLDTESYYTKVEGRTVDRLWPALPAHVAGLIAAFDAHMAAKRASAADTPLNGLRGEILDHARAKAALKPGVFTLEVPTGGGKTLVSLGFALEHARLWGMERIVVAIPFAEAWIETTNLIYAGSVH